MEFERVEQFVLRRPLRELEFRNESGIYTLGNDHARPAWWYVIHQPTGQSSLDVYMGRGLKNVVTMIEQERGAKVERRKQLAEELAIPLNTLRIRAHRLRERLELCVQGCLRRE